MTSQWNPPSFTYDSQLPKQTERSGSNARPLRAIPMPSSHIPKTHSEVQLSEDVAAAEWRDLCMFYRVVQGIRERQTQTPGAYCGGTSAEQVTPPIDFYHGHDRTSSDQGHFEDNGVAIDEDGFLSSVMKQTDSQDHSQEDGGWSIGGYDEAASVFKSTRTPTLVENDTDDDECAEDDGVFNMDL